ncbi:Scr1 family TA system antitoxin-like transcriptional regulator [Streptomyces sp. NPDC088801]|uniref:Scr1 family TA system antitoxin-like transcriptional regulator n=1 Tax=Streptomyces sp. NPDC088801 TaxID=3365903 RepID=UPI0037FB16B8
MTSRPPDWRLNRFAAEMERLRGTMTKEKVKDETGISPVTLWRIENGERHPKESTVIPLLNLFGASPQEREHVMALWRDAEKHDLPGEDDYAAALRDGYNAYMWIERQAIGLWNYQTAFVPGLFQTEAYVRAIIAGMWPDATPEEVQQHVDARMRRQTLLTKPDPLQLAAVVDEAALRRWVGGPEVMAEQMRKLQATAALPHVSLQVIPNAAGAHAGMPGGFASLTFPGATEPEIVYLESPASDQFLQKKDQVEPYTATFESVRRKALPPAESLAFIASVECDYKEAA